MKRRQKIEELSVQSSHTLMDALKKMDELDIKLLLVLDDSKFDGLLSIGDIQRHFIRHQTFDSDIRVAMRKNIKVVKSSDSYEYIKNLMIEHRTEFMPVLDDNGSLDKVIFWEDVFESDKRTIKDHLNLPVVIMAGGQGTRLRPITHIIPKPLVPIGERPILQVIMDNFVENGCDEFHLSVSYKSEMIKAYFDSLADNTYRVSYFKEDKPLGTAGSLSLLKDKIDSSFFVSNCDIIINEDYSEIYKYHVENENDMTAVAFVKETEIPYGTFEVDDNGLLKSLVEKPKYNFLVNAGLYILEPTMLEKIPEGEFFHITHLMEKVKNENGRVGVFPINEGSWLDIGQWQEYQKTLKKFGSGINL